MRSIAAFILFSLFSAKTFAAISICSAIETKGPELVDFSLQLKKSCLALEKLCLMNPSDVHCPASDRKSPIVDRELQNQYVGQLQLTTNELFPFREKFEAAWPAGLMYQVPREDIIIYESKLHLLDDLSRSRSPLLQALVVQLTLNATLEWINLYGDPLRNQNLYIDEFGQPLPARKSLALSKSSQDAAINMAAFSGLVTGILIKPESLFTRKVLQNGKYILVGLRGRLPLNIAAELLIALLPPSAATLNLEPSGFAQRMLPSPAEKVRFELTEEFDLNELDMKSAWLDKEMQIYNEALSQSSFFGAQMFVGYFGAQAGTKIESGLLRALIVGPEAFKILRWLRITPISLAVGYSVETVVEESLFAFKLHRLQARLEIASRNHNNNEIYLATTGLLRLYIDQSLIAQKEIELIQNLKNYSKSGNDANLREKLSLSFHPLNFPESTGAYLIQENLCAAKNQIIDQASNDSKLNKELRTQDIMWRRGAAYKFKTHALDMIKDNLKKIAEFKKFAAVELETIIVLDSSRRSAQIFAAKLKKILVLEDALRRTQEELNAQDSFQVIYNELLEVSRLESRSNPSEFNAKFYCDLNVN